MPTIKRALIFMAMLGVVILTGNTVSAWNGNDATITAEPYDYAKYQSEYARDSIFETVSYIDYDGTRQSAPARVQRGKTVKLAYIPSLTRWGIAIGADTNYRYFEHTAHVEPVVISGTNTVVLPVRGLSMDGYHLAISNDITRDITPIYGQQGLVGYLPKLATLHYWLQYQETSGQLQKPYVYGQIFSENKRFGVFWLNWQQFVRVDFKTGISTAFINRRGAWYDGLYTSRVSEITNDGQYAFMDDGGSVVEIQAGCGYVIDPLTYAGTIDYSVINCREQHLDTTPIVGYSGWRTMFRLAPDEKSATYWMTTFPYTANTYEPSKVTVTAGSGGGRLSYLALGDSYSSGEGDTELNPQTNDKYYLDGTDKDGTDRSPREKCHVSSRSYPFYLASIMQVRDDMKSVACSGAVIDDLSGEGEYMGQRTDDGTPRLQGAANPENLQLDAMNQYIPGRVRQIELVKQAKPRVITLTAGGNDAHFGEIISTCINVPFLSSDATATCYFADSDSGRATLRNYISDQYEPLKKLYISLHAASPDSKIYVVGYPQFVNHTVDNRQCAANVRLNKAEREMVNESVGYMNSVIEHAAAAAGVKYIDISDALKGHMLCDSKENPGQVYVTGIALGGTNETQESYHPNDGGHVMMTNAIKRAVDGQSLLAYRYCDGGVTLCPDTSVVKPDAPSYFGALQKPLRKSITLPIAPAQVQKGTEIVATVDPSTLRANSTMSVTLLSQPRILDPITTLEDGGIRATIRIPDDIEPGYHTLILTGESVSGDPVEIIDFFEIIASEADWDGDGVVNGADNCQYIEPSGEDTDKDGIDDGCDAIISEPPLPQESSTSGEGTPTSKPSILAEGIVPASTQLALAGNNYSLAYAGTTESSEAPLAGLAPREDSRVDTQQDDQPSRGLLTPTELVLGAAGIVIIAMAIIRLMLARRV